MKKTFKEVTDIIQEIYSEQEKNLDGSDICYAFEYAVRERKYSDDYKLFEEQLGEIECVESHGGEDKGSNYYHVYFLKEHDMYIKLQGWYQSYSGTNYNGIEDFTEVKPVEKTITVYE